MTLQGLFFSHRRGSKATTVSVTLLMTRSQINRGLRTGFGHGRGHLCLMLIPRPDTCLLRLIPAFCFDICPLCVLLVLQASSNQAKPCRKEMGQARTAQDGPNSPQMAPKDCQERLPKCIFVPTGRIQIHILQPY